MPAIPPLPPFPTYDELEGYFYDARSYIPGIPSDVASVLRGLYDDLMRFGPPEFPELPELPEVGKLFIVQVPAVVPPPPPPPKSAAERALEWIKAHKWACSIAGLAVVGAAGYSAYYFISAHGNLVTLRNRVAHRKKVTRSPGDAEREIVIILGADAVPYGPTVVRDFQKNGYIVLASVASGEAADDLERDTKGYVRALILDAEEAGSIPHFLRSLSATLSLRFPTTVHGDPYQPTTASQSASLARVASVISFLSLSPADTLPFNSFTSPIVFSETYTHQFATKALSPLSIIHATLPLFRNRKAVGSPTESSANIPRGASVILCVPAVARVGVLGSSSNSMANAAVIQGFNVLRREAAVDPMFQDTRLRFVTLDVGRFGDAEDRNKRKHTRTPSDVGVLSNTLLGIVSASRRPRALDVVWNVWFGSHQSVGAGAMTYTIASKLPTFILDFLLLFSHRMADLRESMHATVDTPPPIPDASSKEAALPSSRRPSAVPQAISEGQRTDAAVPTPSESDSSAYTSEADGEASTHASQVPTRAASTIAESWVSVNDDE